MDPIEFLREHAPFSQLDEGGLAQLARQLEIRYVPQGEVLLQRGGERSQHLWIVRKGAVRLEVDGRQIDLLVRGESFGYPSLLARAEPQVDVVAAEDALCYLVPEETFRSLLERPDFGDFFLEGLSRRLRRATSLEPIPVSGDFNVPVGRLVHRSPVFLTADQTAQEAAHLMRRERISSVLIEAEPMGIVTDRDLRNRVLAEGLDAGTSLGEIMSTPLKTFPAAAPLQEAMHFFLTEGVHHLPVVDDHEIQGVITYADFVRYRFKSPGLLLKRIDKAKSAAALSDYAEEVAGMVEVLLWGGLEATAIGRMVATLNDALVSRLVAITESRLGPPPCPFSWIVFGSEGRREQTLLTDQDNALVFAEDSAAAQRYFNDLASAVVADLQTVGFPPCIGGFMATNWCRSLADWIRLFEQWTTSPEPEAVLDTANFFDYRAVYGTLDLEPLELAIERGASSDVFLAHLARASLGMRPPLGLFHRIRQDKSGIDLKSAGLMPIVGLARVDALEVGSRERSTLARIAEAQQQNLLSARGADDLSEGFRFLFRLRLEAQLDALRQGREVSNRIRVEDLPAADRRHLKETFLVIREMQESLSQRYKLDLLG